MVRWHDRSGWHSRPADRKRLWAKLDHLIRKAESNMSVRAKLKLVSITQHSWSTQSKTLKFTAQYDKTIPEDQRFQEATLSASAEFQIDNPAALAQFELGKSYYVDFSPAA